jgi:hypothetical protein
MSNVPIKVSYRVKSSGNQYTLLQTYTTNSLGVFTITTSLDYSSHDFQITIDGLNIPNPSSTDAIQFNQKVLSQSFNSKDYYRMNTNGNGNLSITDVYLIYRKINGGSWPANIPSYRIFNPTEWSVINNSVINLTNTYPGAQSIILENPTNGGNSTYYLIKTGYIN